MPTVTLLSHTPEPERLVAAAARMCYSAADAATIPPELTVTAVTDEGEVMAVQHRRYPVFGLQFHPESILTPQGDVIMKNFLAVRKGV